MHYPKLNVTIDLSNRLVDLFGEGYDLAIRTGHVADPRLIATQVASRTLYTCAAPSYLVAAGCPANVEELARHECIGGTSDTWHFNVEGREVLHRPKGRFRCNSGHAVIEATISGLGICQLPDFYILPYLRHGMVKLILEEFSPDDEAIYAVYQQRRHLAPKVRHVIDRLKTELGSAMNVPVPSLHI